MNTSQDQAGSNNNISGPQDLIFANAGDKGFEFIMNYPKSQAEDKRGEQKDDEGNEPQKKDQGDGTEKDNSKKGGLCRHRQEGHLVTIVGQGGTGKSILAFQILANLIPEPEYKKTTGNPKEENNTDDGSMSFYFTLEASPAEIKAQLTPFKWAKRLGIVKDDTRKLRYDATELETKNLRVLAIPSPVDDLGSLIDQIRQTIARNLQNIKSLNAVVVDSLGGVHLSPNLSRELSRLKDLAASHRTFLFLLVEDYVYDQNPLIEHYSQTIIHLRHNPQDVPCRQLFIQKARGQVFASGHHQLEIVEKKGKGISVFPSIAAQSNAAHKLLKESAESKGGKKGNDNGSADEPFLRSAIEDDKDPTDTVKNKKDYGIYMDGIDNKPPIPVIPVIKTGSTVFLMGPPGTFKQYIATKFAIGENAKNTGQDGLGKRKHCLYISFKADREAVKKARKQVTLNVESVPYEDHKAKVPTIYFYDARSPVLTPQEVLEEIRREVYHDDEPYSRAVIWGLRRLNDMPNFSGGTAVQFLEALVTLLTARNITSLLIDWPGIEKASTLPIVDLSQYIFLTRICRRRDALQHLPDLELDMLWPKDETQRNHVSLIRIQRTPDGFHRDRGAVLSRNVKGETKIKQFKANDTFERLWHVAGYRWEQDPSLIQGSEQDYSELDDRYKMVIDSLIQQGIQTKSPSDSVDSTQ